MGTISQIVIFGASGDLTARKLIPSLLRNFELDALPGPIQVIGVSRSSKTAAQWCDELLPWLPTELHAAWERFKGCIHWVRADAADPDDVDRLEQRLDALSDPTTTGRLFYLALAPHLFISTVRALSQRGLVESDADESVAWRRVVVEKPFGADLKSAHQLNHDLLQHLREDQIFRIDHYLGKETVQNILALRFQNAIFEPLWNRKHVESVEISVCETVTMEGKRGAYYDRAGASRDMLQNHVLQVLALIAMEPPSSLAADAIRSEKVKVLEALRSFTPEEVTSHVVRARYAASPQHENGYLDEFGVTESNQTETYIAARALIDNWRWSGVPFLLRTGKALHKRFTQVVLRFQTPPLDLLGGPTPGDACQLRPNDLTLLIQPDEGVRLSFLVKRPGAGLVMQRSVLGFDYDDLQAGDTPDAYQRLLLDAINGNATLFIRGDEVEAAWRFVDAIRAGWQANGEPPHEYPAGSHGPSAADDLFKGCEGIWSEGP